MTANSKSFRQAAVEVRIRELGQIFNSLDPSPFAERDLDDQAEAYIVGWAREVDTGAPFRIIIHLPEGESRKAEERGLGSAIGNYFAYRAGMLDRDKSDLLRIGRRALAIGVAVLVVCTGFSQALRTAFPHSAFSQTLAESIIIFGWVANWRPTEIFLYDIWTIRSRVHLYRRLSEAQIELRPFGAETMGSGQAGIPGV